MSQCEVCEKCGRDEHYPVPCKYMRNPAPEVDVQEMIAAEEREGREARERRAKHARALAVLTARSKFGDAVNDIRRLQREYDRLYNELLYRIDYHTRRDVIEDDLLYDRHLVVNREPRFLSRSSADVVARANSVMKEMGVIARNINLLMRRSRVGLRIAFARVRLTESQRVEGLVTAPTYKITGTHNERF